MAPVPRSAPAGQACAPVPSSSAALFVWIMEARETFADLDAVALDATLPPKRRTLSRAAARERYQRARAGLAWLLGVDVATLHEVPTVARDDGPRFEAWGE
jgi:hypothetical protein